MLILNSIHSSYDGKTVLEDLNLSLDACQLHGLMGSNGAGKTTLLNILYGRKSIDSGTVTWNQESLSNEKIGYLKTDPYFYSSITGREYLEIFRLKNPDFDIDKWNTIFELPLDELVETYSSGMKKKLALLGILCPDREIMMLDEPFNNLDMETNQLLGNILKELTGKGKTIILTSHVLESLTRWCDHIHVLGSGRILRSFAKGEFNEIESFLFDQKNKLLIENVKELLK